MLDSKLNRRTALAIPAAATALAATSTTAHANTPTPNYRATPTETVLGGITGELAIGYGVTATYSAATKTAVAVCYPEGIRSPLSIINLETGQQVKTFKPFYHRYDRPEAYYTYPNHQTVTMCASGLLIHFDPATMQAVAYPRARRAGGRDAVTGQTSSITASETGKSYIGDFDGRFCRFILPSRPTEGANIWYSYGTPFGQGADIMAVHYHQGWVYVGLRGQNAGIYRIPETTLDAKAAADQVLTLQDFQNITPDTKVTGVEPRKYAPYQILTMGTQQGPTLLVRFIGSSGFRLNLNALNQGNILVNGPVFRWNQTAVIDNGTMMVRLRNGENFYIVRLDMNLPNPWTKFTYAANVKLGTLDKNVPVLQVAGKPAVIATYRSGFYVSELTAGAPRHDDPSIREPYHEINAPVVAPSELTQLKCLAYIPASRGGQPMVVFAPKWIQDSRVAVIDNPHIGGEGGRVRIRIQATSKRPNWSANQVESFGVQPGGRITVGTYPDAGAMLMSAYDYPGDALTSNRLLATGSGDPNAARPVCQVLLVDGNTLLGQTNKFGAQAAGISLFRARNTFAQPYMKSYPSDAVIPGQNIVSLCALPADGGNVILTGGSVRLENAATSAAKDPDTDAVIAVLGYDRRTVSLSAPKKFIKLPAGVKAVWSILRHSSGRIFALVQYGHHTPLADQTGRLHPDMNTILELDPVTYEVIWAGAEGKGFPVMPTNRTTVSYHGDLKELPGGSIMARTNVFLHHVEIAAPGQGIASSEQTKIYCTSFDVGAQGEIYTAYYDGLVKRYNF